jgi:hypothetical protein
MRSTLVPFSQPEIDSLTPVLNYFAIYTRDLKFFTIERPIIISRNVIIFYYYFPNGRYISCLSFTYATNKGKMLKLHYKKKKKKHLK